jgi:hypothetical protein
MHDTGSPISEWGRQRLASKFFNYIFTDHAGALEPFYRVELRARDISSIEKPVLDPGGGSVQSEEILVPTITSIDGGDAPAPSVLRIVVLRRVDHAQGSFDG